MTSDAVGGIWRYAIDLARGFAPYSIEVHLALMGPPPDATQRKEAAALPHLVLHESSFRLEWMEAPWEDVDAAADWLMKLDAQIRPDVVHLNHYSYGTLPWRSPVVMVAHSCIYSWWSAVYGHEPPAHYGEYHRRVTAGLSGAGALVAPSRSMADAIVRFYKPKIPVRVIPNGTTPTGGPVETQSREKIVTIGRLWDKAKNIALLQRVAPRLPWPVVAVGDQSLEDGAKKTDEEEGSMIYTGRLDPDRVSGLLASSAIYAHPALYEPFGLSVLEAAQAGCALVLSRIGSLVENWRYAALFVRTDDGGKSLEEALLALSGSPELLSFYQYKAKERATKFSISKTAFSYWKVYTSLWEKA
ncbi:MAG: hypothetical protein ABS46_00750 [Cytophagaceae bacterium SCN 52-12]|nr:MAG: hypothetical protein ABS46_00750 [Cytophagaceae bacterium SCN 52-12]